jgi:nucleotide-binding universal stress UspA family protein
VLRFFARMDRRDADAAPPPPRVAFDAPSTGARSATRTVMPLVHKILAATDFSEGAEHALVLAIDVARQYGAVIVIAHVYAPAVVVVPDEMMIPPHDLASVSANIEASLAERAECARSLGVTRVETVLGSGHPADEIVRLAAEQGCDLIVTGTHGRSAVGRFFLGSIADRVVHRAGCAVLTVGPRAHQLV